MIDLFTAATPNGQKIHIMLEECGLDYREHFIDLFRGDQFSPEFLVISPNNKIPAIRDSDGPGGRPISLFESGMILLYLAEKTGRFLPTEMRARIEALEWLFWQMAGFGPMLGQAHHFNLDASERIEYAMNRYTKEAGRLYGVLDRRLAAHEFIAGGAYSIADMAIFPWCRLHGRQGQDLADFPNVERWFHLLAARPAIARDMTRLEDREATFTPESRSNLFGPEQHRRR